MQPPSLSTSSLPSPGAAADLSLYAQLHPPPPAPRHTRRDEQITLLYHAQQSSKLTRPTFHAPTARAAISNQNGHNDRRCDGPIGGLLRDSCDSAQLQLDAAQLQHFEHNGYVSGIQVLDSDQVLFQADLRVSPHPLTPPLADHRVLQVDILRRELDALVADGGHDKRW